MKAITTLFLSLLFLFSIGQTGTIVNDTLTVNGIERLFDIYVPESYDGNKSFPLVLNFHGYGSNKGQQLFYGDFRNIADTADFLICAPQGTQDMIGTDYWNAEFNSTGVDDIAFVDNMINYLVSNYNINSSRIYSTGMSNGGYMSYSLACELEDKITAIASVTGSMVNSQTSDCVLSRKVPIMQIHGTADATVDYDGNSGFPGTLGIEEVVDYWKDKNGCNSDSIYTAIPDINTADNSTAERFEWNNCEENSKVVFYKITNGGHTWPGASFNIPGAVTNQDFNASVEIWNFFKQFSHPTFTSINEVTVLNSLFLQSNPVKNKLIILSKDDVKIEKTELFNLQGKKVLSIAESSEIGVENLSKGLFFAKVYTNKGIQTIKFLKE